MNPHTGFFTFFQRAATHTNTHTNTHHDQQQHHDHNDTHHTTHTPTHTNTHNTHITHQPTTTFNNNQQLTATQCPRWLECSAGRVHTHTTMCKKIIFSFFSLLFIFSFILPFIFSSSCLSSSSCLASSLFLSSLFSSLDLLFSCLARGAGTHGDVLNLHTEVFETDTRGEEGEKEGDGRGVTVSSANHETAHVELSRASERFTERNPWFLPIQGLRTGREQHVPESSNHSLYLVKRLSSIFILRDTAEGIRAHTTHTYAPTHTHQTFHNGFMFFLANISYKYIHIKTCHHESSRTPQHSKWNSVGTHRPQHMHMYSHMVCD